tara:strand:+ start:314 stop:658 length:345 start_codon:yes stop_codon:yes gene_type:complete
MGLTIVQDGRAEVSGSTSKVHLTVTFDDDYPTGGEAFDADDYGFGRMVSISIANKAANGFVASYDAANKKMMLFEGRPGDAGNPALPAAGALQQAGNTRDASAAVFYVTITSRR